MAYRDGDSGIGGWLAFFLLTLGLFTPLSILLAFFKLYLGDLQIQLGGFPGWPAYRIAETILGNVINWDFVSQNLDGQGASRADQQQ